VSNDEGCPPAYQLRQGLLHQGLGLCVQGRSSLVQDDDAGILQEGAGDGDALPLADAELASALAYNCPLALGQAHDEVMGICRFRHRLDFLLHQWANIER
jgi:hypothetical protein